MTDKSTKTEELKTVSIEKDTWILEVPAEICQKEGFAEGTLVSLTLKNSEIQSSYIHPSKKSEESAVRFIGKYSEFMSKMENND